METPQEGITRKAESQGTEPSQAKPQGPWEVSSRCHKKSVRSDLGERDFCGMWREQKPDLLWVEKSIGSEEVEIVATVDNTLRKFGCRGGETPGGSYMGLRVVFSDRKFLSVLKCWWMLK